MYLKTGRGKRARNDGRGKICPNAPSFKNTTNMN